MILYSSTISETKPDRCLNRWWLFHWTTGDNCQWIQIKSNQLSYTKMILKISSAKREAIILGLNVLTHWGRVTHICVGKLTIIGSDNGLSPGRRQAIIWTNPWILLIRTPGTNFSEILSEIHIFNSRKSIWKCRLEKAAILSRPQCVKCGLFLGTASSW